MGEMGFLLPSFGSPLADLLIVGLSGISIACWLIFCWGIIRLMSSKHYPQAVLDWKRRRRIGMGSSAPILDMLLGLEFSLERRLILGGFGGFVLSAVLIMLVGGLAVERLI